MFAIFKRELSSYFTSPLGYVFIAIFYIFSGAFLYILTLYPGTTDLSGVFSMMFYVMMIFIPILTMRLMADDKRQKTDQLTLTAPISLMRLVFGKFLSAFAVFCCGVVIMLIYGIVLSFFGAVNWALIIGNIVGMLLMGAVFISTGLFVSTLTENQMIAAIGGMGLNLLILLIDTLAAIIPIDFISTVLGSLSFFNKYTQFTLGIFSLTNVLYMLSAIVIFLFLTVRILEKRRWA